MIYLCEIYLYEKNKDNKYIDRVANFHIGNGAKVYRVNWRGGKNYIF